MKKKLIAILLAATCALTAGLTGCSGNAATSGTDESKTSDTQSTGDSTAKSDVVAGFVYIGKINDGGYTQAHDAGRLAVEAMGVKTFYVEDVPETVADTKEAIHKLIWLYGRYRPDGKGASQCKVCSLLRLYERRQYVNLLR